MIHLPLTAPVKIALIICTAIVAMLVIAALSDRPLRIEMGSDKGIDFGPRASTSTVGRGGKLDQDTAALPAPTSAGIGNSSDRRAGRPNEVFRQNSRVSQ